MIDLTTGRLSPRAAWAAVAAAWAVTLGALLIWLLGTSTGTLREHLKAGQFWSLEVCLFLVVITGGFVLRGVARELDRADFTRMAILAVVGYPSYRDHVARGQRSQGQQMLSDIAQRQEQFLLDARRYAATMAELRVSAPEGIKYDAPSVWTVVATPPSYVICMSPSAGSMDSRKIFSGVFAATSSMSMPPSVLAMMTGRPDARSSTTAR